MLAIFRESRTIASHYAKNGAIAQLVERMNGIHEATGSNPVSSTRLRGSVLSRTAPSGCAATRKHATSVAKSARRSCPTKGCKSEGWARLKFLNCFNRGSVLPPSPYITAVRLRRRRRRTTTTDTRLATQLQKDALRLAQSLPAGRAKTWH